MPLHQAPSSAWLVPAAEAAPPMAACYARVPVGRCLPGPAAARWRARPPGTPAASWHMPAAGSASRAPSRPPPGRSARRQRRRPRPQPSVATTRSAGRGARGGRRLSCVAGWLEQAGPRGTPGSTACGEGAGLARQQWRRAPWHPSASPGRQQPHAARSLATRAGHAARLPRRHPRPYPRLGSPASARCGSRPPGAPPAGRRRRATSAACSLPPDQPAWVSVCVVVVLAVRGGGEIPACTQVECMQSRTGSCASKAGSRRAGRANDGLTAMGVAAPVATSQTWKPEVSAQAAASRWPCGGGKAEAGCASARVYQGD